MPDEELVTTEAPVDSAIDTAAEPTDSGADTALAEPADGATEPEHATVDEQPQDGALKTLAGPAVVDGRLSPAFKPVLDKLKAESPQVAKAVEKALFFEDRLRRELPGGIKEIHTMRENLEKLGGEEGIQELTGELDGWNKFDEQYTAGDPKVLEFLTETPATSAAFLKIAPAAFEKFRELNPEGYGAYVSQVFVADMQNAQIPLLLERLQDFLPADNPRALEIWQKLQAYVNRIGTLASKAVTPTAAKTNPQDETRNKELETRETNLRRTEWRGDTDRTHRTLYQSEWGKQIGERKLTSEQRATVVELYGLKLSAILKATPKFTDNLNRYFTSNKREGFQKYVESIYKEAVPKALRAAIGQAGVGPSGKSGGQTVQTVGGKAAIVAAKSDNSKSVPAAGFSFVNKAPEKGQVDPVQTSPDMWLAGRAVLRDGKKVSWKR